MNETSIRSASVRRTSLVKVGGGLGIAACLIGLAIFFAACAGFSAALAMAPIPLLLSVPGLVLSIIGGFMHKAPDVEDTHVLSALFVNVMGIVGGAVELAAWQGWQLFPGGA